MTYASAATGPFYHGTRADLAPGDLLAPGHASNYADRKLSWIYFSGTLDAAIQTTLVIPANAGTQSQLRAPRADWVPAFAGMTKHGTGKPRSS